MDQTTSAVHALAATTITVAGITTGLSYELLLAGFAGALASLSYLGTMSVWRRLWSLLTSTLTAGYTAPLLDAWFRTKLPDLAPTVGVLLASSFVLGVTAQALIPGVLFLARRKAKIYAD